MLEFIRRLSAWFNDPAGETPPPARRSPVQASAPPQQREELIRQRLRAVLDNRTEAAVGSVQLFGLEPLRAKLGDRWPRLRDRVHQLTQRLLERMLAPEDVFFEAGAETFIIIFARLGEEEASLLCARLIVDLQQMLLGSDDTAGIVVHAAVRQVSGDIILRPRALTELVPPPPPSPPASAPPPPAPPPPQTTDGMEDELARSLRAALAAASIATTPAAPSSPAAPPPGGGRPPEAEAAIRIINPWADIASRTPPLEVVYCPVWDVGGQALSLYVARARQRRPGGQPLFGYAAVLHAAGLEAEAREAGAANPSAQVQHALLEFDLKALRESVDTYLELYDNRFRFFLSLPVHFETLASAPRRRAYCELAGCVPHHLRSFMSYHIVGLPDGTPTGRVGTLVSALQPHGRSVMIQSHLQCRDLDAYAQAGARGIGVQLTGIQPTERQRIDLGRIAEEAHQRRLKVFTEGIDTVAMEAMAEHAGADFMAGALIGDWTEVPEHVVRLSRTDVVGGGEPQGRP